MTISIIAKTATSRVPVPGGSVTAYADQPGVVTHYNVKGDSAAQILDGMIAAQNDLGQISWTALTENIARGGHHNNGNGGQDRVAVIDTDNADGLDIIAAVNWVNEA